MESSRTKFSVLNVSSNFLILLYRTITSFIVRTVFIKVLGEESLGINSLFTNILSMLSLAELGIGVAMSFSLYSSLAKGDDKKTSTLMSFYKKTYKEIGTFILIAGLILLPFINNIVGETSVPHVKLIFCIFLANTVSLYFISYKEILIQADQKNFKLSLINFLSFFFMYNLQIIFLFITKSFIIFMLIDLIINIIQRISINIYVTRKYKNINFASTDKLDRKEKMTIKNNVGAMFLHKMGNYLVTGTDSIILSKFVGIISVGIYTNYLSIMNMTTALLNSIYTGLTSSFGNLASQENEKVQERVFNHINFSSFVIYGYISIAFLFLINPFINLWIGEKYLLPMSVVILLCANFYMNGLRLPIDTVKEATGTYTQDKYVPIVQAIINLIVSVLLTIKFGVIGVVLGTFISFILVPLWYKPLVVYKYVFKSNLIKYIIDYVKKLITLLICTFIIYCTFKYIPLKLNIINFILKALILSIIYFMYIIIIFRKNEYYIYFKELLFKIINNIFKRKHTKND